MGKQRPMPIKFVPTPRKPAPWRNPLVWIAAVIVGFITSFLLFGGREAPLEGDDRVTEEQARTLPPVEQTVNTQARTAAQADEPAGDEVAAVGQSPMPAAGPSLAPTGTKHGEGNEARDYIQNIRSTGDVQDLAAVFTRAGQLAAAGKQTDAYLLYFFAAREGHAPSAFVLGGLSDPNHYRPGANLASQPDPLQSLKWYRVAASDGYKDALSRLHELEKWVEQRARSGDVHAQQLLLSFR
jgi:hypothetical protein